MSTTSDAGTTFGTDDSELSNDALTVAIEGVQSEIGMISLQNVDGVIALEKLSKQERTVRAETVKAQHERDRLEKLLRQADLDLSKAQGSELIAKTALADKREELRMLTDQLHIANGWLRDLIEFRTEREDVVQRAARVAREAAERTREQRIREASEASAEARQLRTEFRELRLAASQLDNALRNITIDSLKVDLQRQAEEKRAQADIKEKRANDLDYKAGQLHEQNRIELEALKPGKRPLAPLFPQSPGSQAGAPA